MNADNNQANVATYSSNESIAFVHRVLRAFRIEVDP